MAEHKVDGGTMLLFIDPTGGTNYDTVVCLTSIGNSMSVQPIDASSACGPDKSPGAIDISYTFEGQHLQDPITGQISGTDLRILLMAEQTVGWKLSPETPVAGDEIQEGTGFISELSSTYAFDTIGVFSGSLMPYGVPTITVSPPLFSIRINVPIATYVSIGNIYTGGFSPTFDAIVDYGDGTIYNHSGNELTLLNIYNAPGTYLITVEITNPIGIAVNYVDPISDCSIDNLYNLDALNFESFSFDLPQTRFNNPPDFSTYKGNRLELINNLYGNNDIILPATSDTIATANFEFGHFSSSQVNYILATFANYNTVGNLDMPFQTPPAPPTGQGITDKATLISIGWTVNTD